MRFKITQNHGKLKCIAETMMHQVFGCKSGVEQA